MTLVVVVVVVVMLESLPLYIHHLHFLLVFENGPSYKKKKKIQW